MLGFGKKSSRAWLDATKGGSPRQHALPAHARRQRRVHHRQVHHHRQFRRVAVIAFPPLLGQLRGIIGQQRQQLGIIQRIGGALQLARQLPRLPHVHANTETGQRHQDHGQPVLEPLRQHFRPPQQGRQYGQAR